ncbi:serine/threonine kinase [Minicystis rosea]|nr:serine/threonine kinase [Minicystis rosea]
MMRGARGLAVVASLSVSLLACRSSGRAGASDAGLGAGVGAPAADAPTEPEPRPGMVWIPPGVLIAGTPPDRLPRVADEEMAGEQVVMRGFYIDIYPYPDEVGAIPTTNIDQAEARALCETQGKRLCTELELERACKGPTNGTYEYGDTYKPNVCATGSGRTLVPNGVNTSCQSGFGVHDLHGGVWSWTTSQWKRDPAKSGLVSLRGGNGAAGELVGRCANGRAQKPDTRREDVGVRCCAGDPNTFEVVLSVSRGDPLKWQPAEDRIAPQLEKLVPAEVQEGDRKLKIERIWAWHPLGNEELWIGGGCVRPGAKEHAHCGVVIGRMHFDTAVALSWVSSEYWQPTILEAEGAREIFLIGGDRNGAFRRRVTYAWGRITIADKERKKRRKGEKEPRF